MDLIVGAGVSGLAYANFCGHEDYIIIDQDAQAGGYCKTIEQDGFVWDYSGHFFHFRDPEIQEYLMNRISSEIITVRKRSQIYYAGRYIDFPFQKNIHQLPQQEFIDSLYDLFFNATSDYFSFKEMLYSKYGKSIAEKFLIPYNEKLYACDLNMLDKDAMGRFFPKANKEEIIRNFHQTDNESYNSNFTYPRKGAIEYINALLKSVPSVKLFMNERLLSVDLKTGVATTSARKIEFDNLISSIPFPSLIRCCNMDTPANMFSWNKVLVFNFGFDRKGDDHVNHWVYFAQKDLSFYRVGYYDNIFLDERMSLYVELGFQKDADIDIDFYKNKVLNDLRKVGIVTNQRLIASHYIIMDPAYVHITTESIDHVNQVKSFLVGQNIFSIGRYGGWTYCSIEDNIIEAKRTAKKIKECAC